jgi:hypothetical protein
MSYLIIDTKLASEVADDGTTTVAYPTGTNSGTFTGAVGHTMYVGGQLLRSPADFTLTFGTASITITNKSGAAWTSGWSVYLEIQKVGGESQAISGINRSILSNLVQVNLGAPDVADADGIAASQAVDVSEAQTLINGALASGGIVTLDVPRNVVGAWTGTAVLTITGQDEYGATVVESSASGTSLTGKKAFKKVLSAEFSADVTGATVGTGDVLGLPVFLQSIALNLKELEDNAAATAGTLVAGVQTEATATTGDVRGTYDPNSACDGAKSFRLVMALPDPTYKGLDQYAG